MQYRQQLLIAIKSHGLSAVTWRYTQFLKHKILRIINPSALTQWCLPIVFPRSASLSLQKLISRATILVATFLNKFAVPPKAFTYLARKERWVTLLLGRLGGLVLIVCCCFFVLGDQPGCLSRLRPSHCTSGKLRSAISPVMGNSSA